MLTDCVGSRSRCFDPLAKGKSRPLCALSNISVSDSRTEELGPGMCRLRTCQLRGWLPAPPPCTSHISLPAQARSLIKPPPRLANCRRLRAACDSSPGATRQPIDPIDARVYRSAAGNTCGEMPDVDECGNGEAEAEVPRYDELDSLDGRGFLRSSAHIEDYSSALLIDLSPRPVTLLVLLCLRDESESADTFHIWNQ